ncbi:hypothetical protein Val02_50840 [Virgisporangium aliadipatigenens]|uniref:Ricin B lectin domain-containing protein n=1 Tax=Virgisporangium aliadipatigenens TaxID=741659 RepID=A0A8J3YPZ2_9ACTN|nr:RICIN domain-containing protein [Virgisporangium aliadipatigenens]GIJ48198.1 hypothetical protein Val02_50840 [Virgisporangium aliadipatigenens]
MKRVTLKPRARRALVGGVAAAVIVAVATTAGVHIASAEPEAKEGKPVPADALPFVVSAARSCSALNPARVAAQLMANSEMGAATQNVAGGEGIAGLDGDVWKRWNPWPKAERADPHASIKALAHHMCDLVGQLRQANVSGEPWRNALAAYRVGVPEVKREKGIPTAADDYVETTAAYALWYAQQPEFGGAGTSPKASASSPGTAAAKPLPDEYVAPVKAAGAKCEPVTAPIVAAYLVSVSGFNPNALGKDGEQGIAQLRPDIRERFAAPGESVWDAGVSIEILGRAMCELHTELTPLGSDAMNATLVTLRFGQDTARRARNRVDADAKAFTDQVRALEAAYRKDQRIAPPAPSPSPSLSPTSPRPSPSTSGPAVPTVAVAGKQSGKCLTSGGEGSTVTVMPCKNAAEQKWAFHDDGTIRSRGLCLDLRDVSVGPTGEIAVRACRGDSPTQEWRYERERIVNVRTGLCADVKDRLSADRTPLVLWHCVEQDNQLFHKK